MDTSSIHHYDFSIPIEQIALFPPPYREKSKLLYYNTTNTNSNNTIFENILQYIKPNDILVLNNTKVEKSRFFPYNKDGVKFEVLLISQYNSTYSVKIKKSKKLKIGDRLFINNDVFFTIRKKEETGLIQVDFNISNPEIFLDSIGELPLPPYILKYREYTKEDETNYQTVFAEISGSKAAPTAGLHFTQELLTKLKKQGVIIVYIQLFVSLGTFNPIQTDSINNHLMHTEKYFMPEETTNILNLGKKNNQKIIAVGTTALRTLESAYCIKKKSFKKGLGETNIFIKPGYSIKSINALITNFHTPKSTLFVLVCSIIGIEQAHKIYKYALEQGYKFFSYGDSMFIDNIVNINHTNIESY